MRLCVSRLDSEQVILYFIATIQNRDFWARLGDQFADFVVVAQRWGLDIRGILEEAWHLAREGLHDLIADLAPGALKLLQL